MDKEELMETLADPEITETGKIIMLEHLIEKGAETIFSKIKRWLLNILKKLWNL